MPSAHAPRRVGRYDLHGEIGHGGMAAVHLGRLDGAGGFARTVAIKRLHSHLARDPEFSAMLLDEARLAARVRHPNVVQTLDVVADERELALVMEYVQGESLAALLRRARERGEVGCPPAIAVAIMVAVLDGLHAAHEARGENGEPLGIVHRDVSPQNVLVGADGVARVLDFGIAKAIGRATTTREGQAKGKLAYMAPEQLTAKIVDRRVDVYAAAIVLWESLTGRRLFDGATEGILYGRVLVGGGERPSTCAPGIDDELDAIVLRGLSPDPSERFQTAKEMARALESSCEIASPVVVGGWVERLAGDVLARRAERVAAIEAGVADVDDADAAPRSAPDFVTQPTAPLAHDGARAAPPRRRIGAAIGLFFAVLVLLTIGVAVAMSRDVPRGASEQAAASAVVSPASSAGVTDDAAAPRLDLAATSPPDAGKPAKAARPPSRSAKPRRSVNDCDPPVWIDEHGYRRYKPHCVH